MKKVSPKRRRWAVLAGVIAVIAGSVLAYATIGRGASSPASEWTWADGVPGKSTSLDNSLRNMLSASKGVTPASVTEVVSIGQGERRNELLAASDDAGTVCLAERAVGNSPFTCLDDRYDPYAVVVFPVVGGSTTAVVDRISLVGIARADVARVALSFADGNATDLPLNEWRAFSYAREGTDSLPTMLRAYDSAGTELQHVGLSASAPDG